MNTHGKVIFFGSGETSPTGKAILRKIFQILNKPQQIAILETPAGFQPNCEIVAQEIAHALRVSLGEFIAEISVIPARKKGIPSSPDNESILTPLKSADFIFLGPGSPSYTIAQLKGSKAFHMIQKKWNSGATLCFSSAAAIAMGNFGLPVYEIYKVGEDLHWKKGLNILQDFFSTTIITHWDNTEGGWNLDTRYCYMGEERFNVLKNLLPPNESILGIDEHTAIVFDFAKNSFEVYGKGVVTLLQGDSRVVFTPLKRYDFQSFDTLSEIIMSSIEPQRKSIYREPLKQEVIQKELPLNLQSLFLKREQAKKNKKFKEADSIRGVFQKNGYSLEDTEKGQKIYLL